MAISSEDSRKALLSALSKALDSYERGKLNPLLISALLEQLQVVLEAVAADGSDHTSDLTSDLTTASYTSTGGTSDETYSSRATDQDEDDAVRADGHVGMPSLDRVALGVGPPSRGWAAALSGQHPQHHRQGQSSAPGSVGGPSWEQRRLQQLESQMEVLRQENQRLLRQVAELGAAVAGELERADTEAAATAAGPRGVGVEGQQPQQDRCGCADLGPLRVTNEAVRQQLADSRAELVAAASRVQGGPSRAEAVLVGELEQQRQVAASLRRELQKAVASSAREKEALSHEVRHWQLAANQAATVAETAQQKVKAAEQRLEAQAEQVRSQARELGALQQQLAASRASLEQRTARLERLDGALLQPLLAWHVDADPAVVPGLVAGLGAARASRASPPRRPCGLARGGRDGGSQGKSRSDAGAGADLADGDPAAEHKVKAAVAAFEALRATAQQARSAREQLQSALDAREELRNLAAMERATAELRAAEVQRLSEVEARQALQVEELTAELAREKLESAQALKAAQKAAEEAQAQRSAAAYERGRQMGDRQAAVAVAALRGELQDHAMALQRERELCEQAVVDARRAGELAVEAARREGEVEVEAALRRARAEWEHAVADAERRAEAAARDAEDAMAEAARQREVARQRAAAEAELQAAAETAERRAEGLAEALQRSEERAAEALAKCEQYLQQVTELTRELQAERQKLAEKDALAATVAKENAAATAELQARLCECRQRLATQAEQLEEYASHHDGEQAHALESLRYRLEHVAAERDSLQEECVALRQQLSAAQAAAAGVEVEMDAIGSALDAHKAARAAAEEAAEEARRSAAAATAAAEDAAARVAALTHQLQEATLVHMRELDLLEARRTAELDAAQSRYQAELEGLQARLKMLRLKQSRVMAYVDDVFMSAEEQQLLQQAGAGQSQGMGAVTQHQHQQQSQRRRQPQLDRDRDQLPRWEPERDWESPAGEGSWAEREGRQGWAQQARAHGGGEITQSEDGLQEQDDDEEGREGGNANVRGGSAAVRGGRSPLGGGGDGQGGWHRGAIGDGGRGYSVERLDR